MPVTLLQPVLMDINFIYTINCLIIERKYSTKRSTPQIRLGSTVNTGLGVSVPPVVSLDEYATPRTDCFTGDRAADLDEFNHRPSVGLASAHPVDRPWFAKRLEPYLNGKRSGPTYTASGSASSSRTSAYSRRYLQRHADDGLRPEQRDRHTLGDGNHRNGVSRALLIETTLLGVGAFGGVLDTAVVVGMRWSSATAAWSPSAVTVRGSSITLSRRMTPARSPRRPAAPSGPPLDRLAAR